MEHEEESPNELNRRAIRHLAATNIQRIVRGKHGRVFTGKLRVVRHRRELQKRYESRKAIFEFYFEQVGAAIKIQRWFLNLPWRRKRIWRQKHKKQLDRRKLAKIIASELDNPVATTSSFQHVEASKLSSSAALTLTRCVRGFLGRLFVSRVRFEVKHLLTSVKTKHLKAVVLQRLVRGFLVRRKYPRMGGRSRSLKLKRQRYLHSRSSLVEVDTMRRRRTAIYFPNLVIGEYNRIATLAAATVAIQAVWRRKLAYLAYFRRKEEYGLECLVKLQRWTRRVALIQVFRFAAQLCREVMELRARRKAAAIKIQRQYRKHHCNVVILDRLHRKWVGVRKIQETVRRILARNRRKLALHLERSRLECSLGGETLCTKTVFFLEIEFMWAGIRKTTNLDVQHELQMFYVSQTGPSRMLDVLKMTKIAKLCPDLMEDGVITANVVELQFSKVKSVSEKKLDYGRTLDLFANLAAIRFLGIPPPMIGGAMAETPCCFAIPALKLAYKDSKNVRTNNSASNNPNSTNASTKGSRLPATAAAQSGRKTPGGRLPMESSKRPASKPSTAASGSIATAETNVPIFSHLSGDQGSARTVGSSADGDDGASTASSTTRLPATGNNPVPHSSADIDVPKLTEEFRFGRLAGKSALVTKFVMEFLSQLPDYQRLVASVKKKAADVVAQDFLLKTIRFLQDFCRRRVTRMRWFNSHVERVEAKRQLLLNRSATRIQTLIREFLGKRRVAKVAQRKYNKYLDGQLGIPYWFNPRTACSFWTKPPLLRHLDCGLPVRIPSAEEQYVVICNFCNDATATCFCHECDEAYCDKDYQRLHLHGHRKDHHKLPIENCVECEYQVGTRLCSSCKDSFCDSCFRYLHGKGRYRLHLFSWCCPVCSNCSQRASQWFDPMAYGDDAAQREHSLCTVCFTDRYGDPQERPDAKRLKFLGPAVEKYRQARAEEKKAQDVAEEHRRRSALVLARRREEACRLLQRFLRGRMACRRIRPFLEERREFMRLRAAEMPIRNSLLYILRNTVGAPIHLKSDTTLEKVLKMYPGHMHSVLVACIEGDWKVACRLVDEHEAYLKKVRAGMSKEDVARLEANSLQNLLRKFNVTVRTQKAELELLQIEMRLAHLRRNHDALLQAQEEAKLVESTTKKVKDKINAEIKASEKALKKVNKDKQRQMKVVESAHKVENDFLGPRGLQRLVTERRKHGLLMPFTVDLVYGSRAARVHWGPPPADKSSKNNGAADDASGEQGATGDGDEDDFSLMDTKTGNKKLKSLAIGESFKSDVDESVGEPEPSENESSLAESTFQGKWKEHLKESDAIMIQGMTFTVVSESKVLGLAVSKPKTTTSLFKQPKKAASQEDRTGHDSDDDLSENSRESLADQLQDLEEDAEPEEEGSPSKSATSGNEDLSPSLMGPVLPDEWTPDHMALDRPWVLPDVKRVPVFKAMPTPLFSRPGKLAKTLLLKSYPLQKLLAITAITLYKIGAAYKYVGTNAYEDDSETGAQMKEKAVAYELRSQSLLKYSTSVVQMSYDFTLRRQLYRLGRAGVRVGVVLGKLAFKSLKRRAKAKPVTPYERWETSGTKEVVGVTLELDGEEPVRFGEIKLDLRAPADILREYINRNFREQLNETIGDAYNFQVTRPDGSIVTIPRKKEPGTYCKDITTFQMDKVTMEGSMGATLVREKGKTKQFIPVFAVTAEEEESKKGSPSSKAPKGNPSSK